MRYSVVLSAALLVASAIAIPLDVEKRDYYTEYKTIVVTEYVEAAQVVTVTHRRHGHKAPQPTYAAPKPTTTSIYVAPKPATTSVYAAPEPTTTSIYAAPEPTYAAPAPPKPDVPSGSTGNTFADECIATHNKWRAKYGVGSLTWDPELAQKSLVLSSSCNFNHDRPSQNLAAGYGGAANSIDAWADEGRSYSYDNPNFSMETGHFTQVVWKGATKVGCATYNCNGANGTPGDFVTCDYDTGNVIGYFSENVLPPVY